MFNRLINTIFTLYNRVAGVTKTKDVVITSVNITPNPINAGQTYLISVAVEEVDST